MQNSNRIHPSPPRFPAAAAAAAVYGRGELHPAADSLDPWVCASEGRKVGIAESGSHMLMNGS